MNLQAIAMRIARSTRAGVMHAEIQKALSIAGRFAPFNKYQNDTLETYTQISARTEDQEFIDIEAEGARSYLDEILEKASKALQAAGFECETQYSKSQRYNSAGDKFYGFIKIRSYNPKTASMRMSSDLDKIYKLFEMRNAVEGKIHLDMYSCDDIEEAIDNLPDFKKKLKDQWSSLSKGISDEGGIAITPDQAQELYRLFRKIDR